MKTLTLVRHASSNWKNPESDDFTRTLNKRGEQNAPIMGKRLAENGTIPDQLITSPAVRAYQTAMIFAEEIGYDKEKIENNFNLYEAGVSELIEIIHQNDDKHHHVMMVGHNPGFHALGCHLTNVKVDSMPPCSVFCIAFDVDSWQDVSKGNGRLLSFDYPGKQ